MSDDKRYTLDEVKDAIKSAGKAADELSMMMHFHFGELQGYMSFGGERPKFDFHRAMGLADKTATRLDSAGWMVHRLAPDTDD